MKKRRYKLTAKVTVMTLLIGGCLTFWDSPITTEAAEEDRVPIETEFTVTDNGDGTGTITGAAYAEGNELDIPGEINGLKITRIGDSAFAKTDLNIKYLHLPDSIEYIGDSAFIGEYKSNFHPIQEVNIPDNIEYIGNSAFEYQSVSLEDPVFPSSLEFIGYDAFAGSYYSVYDPWYWNDGGGFNVEGTLDLSQTQLTEVQGFAINGITNIKFPQNVKKINSMAFYLNSIDQIKIPSTVEELGYGCFEGNRMSKITLQEGLKILGSDSLRDNELTSIEIPKSVEKICKNAFYLGNDSSAPESATLNKITILGNDTELEYDIFGGYYPEDFEITMYGLENSTAQSYAEQYGLTFKQIDGESSNPDPDPDLPDVDDPDPGSEPEEDPMYDTDCDGLPDEWEINGADTDGDGTVDVPLNVMGADPNKPDVFVEIDWMVRPESKFLFFTTQKEYSFAPSPASLRFVYEAFKAQGINLHIDAGPGSIDHVTGRVWGNLSGGNEIPYEKTFILGGQTYQHWNEVVNENFEDSRQFIFRHCIFLNQYEDEEGSSSSGASFFQYFIVAMGENENNIAEAGTFMHELGHTLGLGHGGVDHEGNENNDNYKPNYLSVMNYSFQFTGLSGTNTIDYSRYTLPDLDETNLSEFRGIDPDGVTAGTGIGTKINGKTIPDIAWKSIDYNGNGIGDEHLSYNLNTEDKDNPELSTALTGINDWENLTYSVGNIGSGDSIAKGISAAREENDGVQKELSSETALKLGLLGNPGSGEFRELGPWTLATDDIGQSVYIRAINRGPTDADFSIKVGKSEITDEETIPVKLNGSIGELGYQDIPILVHGNNAEGTYSFHVTMTYEDEIVCENDITVELTEFSSEKISALDTMLDDEAIDLPDVVRNEYVEIRERLDGTNDDISDETQEPDQDDISGNGSGSQSSDNNNTPGNKPGSQNTITDNTNRADTQITGNNLVGNPNTQILSKDEAVKTGDDNNIIPYIVGVAVSIGLILCISVMYKKRKDKYR